MYDYETMAKDFLNIAQNSPEVSEVIWKTPIDAIIDALNKKDIFKKADSREIIYKNMNFFLPRIEEWIRDNGVTRMSYYSEGSSALAFKAMLTDSNEVDIVRIGEDLLDFNTYSSRSWCPLVLQPYCSETIKDPKPDGLLLEILPFVKNVTGRALLGAYGKLLEEDVLAGTLYMVHKKWDLGVLGDGTPVYYDTDSLHFINYDVAEENEQNHMNEEWQQETMRIIYDNCAKLKLPHPLQWVIESNGRFVTKQSEIYKNRFPRRPETRKMPQSAVSIPR